MVVKRPGHGVDHPAPTSADVKSTSIPLLPLWGFMVYSRVNFTFFNRISTPKLAATYTSSSQFRSTSMKVHPSMRTTYFPTFKMVILNEPHHHQFFDNELFITDHYTTSSTSRLPIRAL